MCRNDWNPNHFATTSRLGVESSSLTTLQVLYIDYKATTNAHSTILPVLSKCLNIFKIKRITMLSSWQQAG